MVVNPTVESAYLKGLCLCTDHRDCREPPVRTMRMGFRIWAVELVAGGVTDLGF